jgi:hypothetical protein
MMLTLRTFLLPLLAAVMLFAQQGSTLHTLQHVFAEQTTQQNKQLPHTTDCEQCTAYAQLGSALNNATLSFALDTSALQAFARHYPVLISHHTLPASARGPPSTSSTYN